MKVHVVVWASSGVISGSQVYGSLEEAEEKAEEVVYDDVEDDSTVITIDIPSDLRREYEGEVEVRGPDGRQVSIQEGLWNAIEQGMVDENF